MFSLKIVASDAFLDMPVSARELYFQLGMYADDDGFINPKKVVRMIGASDDDLKLLVVKRFVLPFENGVIVIKHWLINNLVRKDFYQPTVYIEEKSTLKIKENKAYTENVNNLLPQVRLGKDRIGKVSIISNAQSVAGIPEVLKEFESINPSIKRMYGNKTQRAAAERLITQFGLEKVLNACRASVAVINEPYAPKITTPYQLETEWAKLVGFLNQTQNKKFSKGKQIISST
jgi:hypothetical protein